MGIYKKLNNACLVCVKYKVGTQFLHFVSLRMYWLELELKRLTLEFKNKDYYRLVIMFKIKACLVEWEEI